MKIFNAMFSKEMGGIEQAFLDYLRISNVTGVTVIPVIHQSSKIQKFIYGPRYKVHNFSKFDFFTIMRLKEIIKCENPDCIITHGTRAARLFQQATKTIPIISVCHNYSYKQLLKSPYIIAVSEGLRSMMLAVGYNEPNIRTIPNMIAIEEGITFHAPVFRSPPVIGVIGRFVKKKGFDVFIQALEILKTRNIGFHAVLAGDGEERKSLEKLVHKLQLKHHITFVGWVGDKADFYEKLDVFCLPSIHEPFGIVVLEAFKYSKPLIATRTDGPSDIIVDGSNGLLCSVGEPINLADKIELLLSSQELASKVAENGFDTMLRTYSADVVVKQIHEAIQSWIGCGS